MTLSTARRAHGFSIIELMVAMAIGMILTMLIGQIFINSREMFASVDNLSRMQENARFALTTLTRAVRVASHKSDPRLPRNDVIQPGPSGVGVLVALGAFRTLPTVAGVDGSVLPSGTAATPDILTVRFQGSGNGTGTADGTVVDCGGTKIDAILTPFPDTRLPGDPPNPNIVVNTYLIQADPNNNNEPSLVCNRQALPAACVPGDPACLPPACTVAEFAAGTCLVLIPGVENMQIVYGYDEIGPPTAPDSLLPDGSIDRFVPASNTVLTAPASPASWNNVLSVRISLLMRTDDRVASTPANTTVPFLMAGTNVFAPSTPTPPYPDTRLRRVFTTVVDLRNRTQ